MDTNIIKNYMGGLTRIKNQEYQYTIQHDSINYSECCPLNSVIKLTHPTPFEAKFPWCIVTNAEGSRKDDIIELLERPAFKVSHINHEKLLCKSEIKLYPKKEKISLYHVQPAFDSLIHFERHLLRQNYNQQQVHINQLQNRIQSNAGAIVNKHYKDINGSLNSVNYGKRCGANMPKEYSEVLNIKWEITGRKPNRQFQIDLSNCPQQILNKQFDDGTLLRSKKVGKRNILTQYKAYNISIKYIEKTIRMTTSYKIACKIGKKGRWKYTG
eukprot:501177_1